MVEWAMSKVIRNLVVQKKMQEKLDSVISHERIMTKADFPSLPYLQCSVKESLRLHPLTLLMLLHKASSDVKLDSYDIPKGSNLVVRSTNLDEYLGNHTLSEALEWPFKFRPKWLKEENIDIKGHNFWVLPFEVGWRVCPGTQLGINLVTSILGHLLQHFQWALLDGVGPGNVDMEKNSGIVAFMRTPLLAVAVSRLLSHLYKHVLVDR
uniref:Uncharacterized protein n=1 Tax=Ananas comosus var. bracteatus TaxID=296719 RepID=A0A6V7NF95_ANACO|nr:unnamed protein product [Ananas comosus var. bracteatus]